MLLYRDQGTALQSVSAFSARKCFTPSLKPWVPGSRSAPPKTPRWRGGLWPPPINPLFGVVEQNPIVSPKGDGFFRWTKFRFVQRPRAEGWLLDARFLNTMTETARATFCRQRSLQTAMSRWKGFDAGSG
jgi:hypothetical protein